ncbi:DER1-domain-containing protein [Lophiostoma macrostomum CBS 122681]|uniref:Derlin n=1 Tax=Lophiostoma macrostomum CBS 122681 TaxID=1314788 RepID=A0A6A6T0L7_9PLEO|nr:DER1-domain-containing protein [Lophiostoma macrostomum CBS 122681]
MADVFWSLPPVTRTITASAVVVSALGYSGIIHFMNLIFFKDAIFTVRMIPQIWRLVTAFMITGPKLGILLDPYFLYQYGSGLEIESSRFSQPGDFFVYTAFVASVIVSLAGYVLHSYTFLGALSLAFAYTYAQDNPTRQVSLFIITFQAKFLPFAMILMTFVMDSPTSALTQATGLLAAHLFDFLTRIWPAFGGGRNYISTPQVVKGWFARGPGGVQQRSFGTAFQGRTRDEPASARTSGRSGGWDGLGPGRRLGE